MAYGPLFYDSVSSTEIEWETLAIMKDKSKTKGGNRMWVECKSDALRCVCVCVCVCVVLKAVTFSISRFMFDL
jgi:hypothetical protein